MGESSRVGPIVFSHPNPRTYLEQNGYVYTIRTHDRTTGNTWWRASRTGPKEGDCIVHGLGEINPQKDGIAVYTPESGFGTIGGWRDAIRDQNDGDLPETAYLYLVEST